MGFSLKGFVLEPPRVGAANSPFTSTPNDIVSDPVVYAAAYPSDESAPRSEYLVFVEAVDGNLPTAQFAWTKNEGVVLGGNQIPFPRFDYEGATQRFRTLPGSALTILATPLGPNSNTTRLKVQKPTISDLVNFPIRVSIGTDSGTTFVVSLVPNDGSFGAPPPGTVELSLATGNLNWNAADLTTFSGQTVRFQSQSFASFKDSNGRIGLPTDPLLLSPPPATGQSPLLRFGSGLYLNTVEVPDDSFFTVPPSGTVQWALSTGRLNFNPADITANPGKAIYYDGVTFARSLTLPTLVLGVMPLGYTSLIIAAPPAPGGDLVFRAGAHQFPQIVQVGTAVTDFVDPIGQQGVVQYVFLGATTEVRFSEADRIAFAGQPVTVTIGDLVVDHGISLRLFRDPVNLDASSPTLKDVASIYPIPSPTDTGSTGAILASPIVAQPQVFLPALPIDQIGFPLSVFVEQGTGSFTGVLPRLDVPAPPTGLGYTLNIDQKIVQYAQRKFQSLIPLLKPSGAVALPDPLVIAENAVLELETGPGTGIYTPLVQGQDVLLEPLSGVASFVTTQGVLISGGGNATTAGGVVTAPSADFIAEGVLPGDVFIIASTTAQGLYTVRSVSSPTILTLDVVGPDDGPFTYEIRRGREILADRYFKEVILADPATKVELIRILGSLTNNPRLSVPSSVIGRLRIRFDLDTFSVTVTAVATDADFSDPSQLSAGNVEVSRATGNLNFGTDDISAHQSAYSVTQLRQQIDYVLSPGLGLIDFTQRMMALDEGLITYVPIDTNIGNPLPAVTEPMTFLVRKEITQAHPSPTSTLTFNLSGRRVSAQPTPAVFRGGRPQTLGIQCDVDVATSTITFLPDNIVTDALPHGATVSPDERVYIDYFVLQAIGGEKTTSVLQSPMSVAQLSIQSSTNVFTLSGDFSASFPSGFLLRIEKEDVYLLQGATYDAVKNTTTVRIVSPQLFQNDFNNPHVFISSGPLPYATLLFQPSYFVTETLPYDPVPRGSNAITFASDRTSTYKTGTIIALTDVSNLRFYAATAATYDSSSDRTTVTVATAIAPQATFGTQTLKYSVRPILEASTSVLQTNRVPVLTEPYTVYRRISGQPGTVLGPQPSAAYTLDESGRITFATALVDNEELGILYTGHTIVSAGRRVRASYTNIIVPDTSNGLLNQILKFAYSLYAPDTFYYRVETFTNFRGELAQQYSDDAKSGSPAGGPTTSNASTPLLSQQGRPSLFFNEGHLANEDIVARSSLVFYNDVVNLLEDFLQDIDGRIVGYRSGRFKFDGNLNNPTVLSVQAATNQIDDVIKISDAPYQINFAFPSFTVTSIGTFQALYTASPLSRFYPTFRHAFGVAAPGVNTGDPILDLGAKNVAAVADARTRPAFAQATIKASVGTSVVQVDAAQGSADFARPPFLNGMKCVVQTADGTFLVPVGSEIVVAGTFPTSITFTAPLALDIPPGATIYRSPADDSNGSGGPQPIASENVHYGPTSYGVDPDKGLLLYVKAFPPLDGSVPLVPLPLTLKQIPAGQPLSADVAYFNSLSAPARAPVFDGKSTDDDGEHTLPLLGPALDLAGTLFPENPPFGPGNLTDEIALIQTPTGLLRLATLPSFVSTGSLDVTNTIITLTAGTFPAPTPTQYDLIRIPTNGSPEFRRVVSSTPTTVTVDVPFLPQGPGFTFVVGVSTTLASGVGTFAGNTLTDAGASFTTTAIIGYTVTITTTGERRQITLIIDDQNLTFSGSPIVAVVGYKVTNSLSSFGGAPGTLLSRLNDALQGELQVLTSNVPPAAPNNERAALSNALDRAFTDVAVGVGTGNASGTTLNDPGATFLSSGVTQTDLLYIRSGPARGVYQIASIPSETSIIVATPFPVSDPAASYRVVSSFGLGFQGASDLFTQLAAVDDLITSTSTFDTLINTPIVVLAPGPVVDFNAYANPILTSDLDTRELVVNARQASFADMTNGPIGKTQTVLSATEKLYDKRFTWIDARINLQSGILVKKNRAVLDRLQAQVDLINALTKLLSVQ